MMPAVSGVFGQLDTCRLDPPRSLLAFIERSYNLPVDLDKSSRVRVTTSF